MRQFSAVLRQMNETSAELTALASGAEVDAATARLLGSVLHADELLWTEIDLRRASATVRAGVDLVAQPSLGEALARTASAHPAVASYLDPDDDRRPRRVTDVVDLKSWTNSPAYAEAFAGQGAMFQLSLVTNLTPATGAGWVLTRSRNDFTEADVEVATWLLPFLTLASALARSLPSDARPAGETLTARERAVLVLLGQGLAAASIGRRLGITEYTVRKHLNHVYAKLGVHDRLGAVLAGSAGTSSNMVKS